MAMFVYISGKWIWFYFLVCCYLPFSQTIYMTSTVPCKCSAKEYIHLPNQPGFVLLIMHTELSECIEPTILFKDCHPINTLLNTRELCIYMKILVGLY